jgi:ribosome-binding factor A
MSRQTDPDERHPQGGSKRMVRVDEQLRRELAMLCEEIIVPQAQTLLTITKVQCAPDLHDAIVFVSVLGSDEQRAAVMRLLVAARKRLQHELSRRVILKYTPRLTFRDDRTAEKAGRVLAILDDLHLPPQDEAGSAAPRGEDE